MNLSFNIRAIHLLDSSFLNILKTLRKTYNFHIRLTLIAFITLFSIKTQILLAQNDLNFYLKKAYENSPALKEIKNLESVAKLQNELNYSQNSAFQTYLSADYLFAPYFNNNGKIISANPDPKAIGYDAGITNGGLYSALVNVEKSIFNGGLTSSLKRQIDIQQEQNKFNYDIEQRSLQRMITEQYLNAYRSLMNFHLTEEVVKNIEAQLKLTGELVEKGYAKSQNYLLLKIELQSQQISLKENFQTYKNDLLQLNSLCGIKDTQTVFIDSVQIQMDNGKNKFNFLEKYKLDSLAAANQQQLFETKYQPQVKLFFNTGLNAVDIEGIQRKFGFSAGINFQLPVFDGGQKSITRQQNEIAINTINNYKHFAAVNIENQKQILISNIKIIEDNLKNLSDQLKNYNDLIALSNKQLRTGDISMIDYLTILRNFIELRKAKIEKEISLQREINNYNYWNE